MKYLQEALILQAAAINTPPIIHELYSNYNSCLPNPIIISYLILCFPSYSMITLFCNPIFGDPSF